MGGTFRSLWPSRDNPSNSQSAFFNGLSMTVEIIVPRDMLDQLDEKVLETKIMWPAMIIMGLAITRGCFQGLSL